jgi:hypothetical protein
MANWKYNVAEKIFNEDGTPIRNDFGQGQAPYGFHFYVKGQRKATPGAAEGVQDYGVAPEDATTAYFPAQGLMNWGYSIFSQGEHANVTAHTNAIYDNVYGPTTKFMKATAKGEFFNDTANISWGEQQAKAMPVRCFRE